MRLYESVSVYADNALEPSFIIEKPTIAHFWSPDSKQIAYVSLSETPGVLCWAVMDIETQQQSELVDFVPSEAQLTMFQFFDQYAYSYSLWSPDSDALVFAGNLSTDALTASFSSGDNGTENYPAFAHESGHIIVVSLGEQTSTQVIAEGFMATWSPN
mgnify:CR=1 FL=1